MIAPDRVPNVPRAGFGLGLDLPWGQRIGLVRDPVGGDRPSDAVMHFLSEATGVFDAAVFSWQALGRGTLRASDHFAAFDALWNACDAPIRGLFHTALNLGTSQAYDRTGLLEVTEALIERYSLQWVNEDLGLWSMGGKPLPYPLPPLLTDDGLKHSIQNVIEVQQHLSVPLVVGFPGFDEGIPLCIGPWDAYDFFRRVIEDTGSPCTLDVGHLLSWRWLRGHRGAALLGDIERLPLHHCVEVHLSGCVVKADAWWDAHHGVLRDEQFRMLEVLLRVCPNLKLVALDDPRFDDAGRLVPRTVPSFERLFGAVNRWRQSTGSA